MGATRERRIAPKWDSDICVDNGEREGASAIRLGEEAFVCNGDSDHTQYGTRKSRKESSLSIFCAADTPTVRGRAGGAPVRGEVSVELKDSA